MSRALPEIPPLRTDSTARVVVLVGVLAVAIAALFVFGLVVIA